MATHSQMTTNTPRPRTGTCNRSVVSLVLTALLIFSSTPAATADSDPAAPALRAERLVGGGDWQVHGKNKLANQHWNLDLRRGPGNTLEGTVDLSGSPLATHGIVRAKLQGVIVDGTITGEDGELVATIHGYLTKLGCEGTYTDRTGETGNWEWQGQLPE